MQHSLCGCARQWTGAIRRGLEMHDRNDRKHEDMVFNLELQRVAVRMLVGFSNAVGTQHLNR